MATIADYLEDLNDSKELLVDTLINKGVSASYNMGYTELVALVDDISGGGTSGVYKVRSVADLDNISNPQDGDVGLVENYIPESTGNINVDSPNFVTTSSITFPSSINYADWWLFQQYSLDTYGLEETRYSRNNLMHIYGTNMTYSTGTITIELTVPTSASSQDDVVITATYECLNGNVGTYTLVNSVGLDNHNTYESDNLSYIKFQNFQFIVTPWTTYTTSSIFNYFTYTIPGYVDGYTGFYVYDATEQEWIEALTPPTVPEKIQTGIYNTTQLSSTFMGIGSLYQTFSTNQNVSVNEVDFSMTCATGRPYDYDGSQLTGYRLDCTEAFDTSSITSLEARSSFLINKDSMQTTSAPVYLFMDRMFYDCINLTTINNLDSLPNNNTDFMMGSLYETFYGCTDLDSNITISLVNPYVAYNSGLLRSSSISDIYRMIGTFYGCTSLKNIRIAWCSSTSNPIEGVNQFLGTSTRLIMNGTFYGCTNLEVIDLSYIKLLYNNNSVVSMDSSTFNNVPSTCTAYVCDSEDSNYLSNFFNGNIVVGHSNSSLWNDVTGASGGGSSSGGSN